MAHARRGSFPRTGGSSRRRTDWSGGPRTGAALTATAAGNNLVSTGSQVLSEGMTLIRFRGEFVAWLESVGSVGDGFSRWAVGVCNVTENAFGIGVTAVPDPVVDAAWDGWLYHRNLGPIIGLSVTESENTGPLSQVRMEVDSKAMRKQRNTDFTIACVSFQDEVGVATVAFGFQSRILDKLP